MRQRAAERPQLAERAHREEGTAAAQGVDRQTGARCPPQLVRPPTDPRPLVLGRPPVDQGACVTDEAGRLVREQRADDGVALIPRRLSEGGQPTGRRQRVVVQGHDRVVVARPSQRPPARPVRGARPPERAVSTQQLHLGEVATQHDAGPVGGPVVDHDHLSAHRLFTQRLQASAGHFTAVVHRDDDVDHLVTGVALGRQVVVSRLRTPLRPPGRGRPTGDCTHRGRRPWSTSDRPQSQRGRGS